MIDDVLEYLCDSKYSYHLFLLVLWLHSLLNSKNFNDYRFMEPKSHYHKHVLITKQQAKLNLASATFD